MANKVYVGNMHIISLFHLTPTALSVARRELAATHVGNYALFGGGFPSDAVDAYNTSLTRSTPTALSVARGQLAATHVGNYALFGGGYGGSYTYSQAYRNYRDIVDAYDTSLTRSTPTALSVARLELAATHVGNYALFGGGDFNGTGQQTVDAYNASLTRSTPSKLGSVMYRLAATHIGDYALFGGGLGSGSSPTWVVYAYNTSLTRSTPTALSVARGQLAATHVGNYALFGGGRDANSGNTSSYRKEVDIYNASLTHSTADNLGLGRECLAATHVGNYALFGGGSTPNGNTDIVDAYNTSLTRSTPTALSVARYYLAATHVGNYALFGGGFLSDAVDAYDSTQVIKYLATQII